MGASKTAGWVAGTVVAVLVIVLAGYFLVAGPRFDAAAATNEEAASVAAQNEILQLKINKLKADAENLEQYRAEVASLQAQIPAGGDLAEYTREVSAVAESSGAFLLEFSPGVGLPFTLPVTAAPAPAPVEETTEDDPAADAEADGTLGDGVATPAPTGPVVPEGFVAVPYSARVVGTYEQVAAFLEGLQTQTERLFLVTALDGTRQQQAEATPARPATADGDVEMLITGYTYVLREVLQAPVEEPTEEAPAPLPGSDRNPFAPLPGTTTGD